MLIKYNAIENVIHLGILKYLCWISTDPFQGLSFLSIIILQVITALSVIIIRVAFITYRNNESRAQVSVYLLLSIIRKLRRQRHSNEGISAVLCVCFRRKGQILLHFCFVRKNRYYRGSTTLICLSENGETLGRYNCGDPSCSEFDNYSRC